MGSLVNSVQKTEMVFFLWVQSVGDGGVVVGFDVFFLLSLCHGFGVVCVKGERERERGMTN